MSKKYKYGYCPKVNSAYRDIKDGLHNSNGELHYREQIKIYRKNQQFTQDLSTFKKDLIRNKVYTKIKGLFVDILNNNINRADLLLILNNASKYKELTLPQLSNILKPDAMIFDSWSMMPRKIQKQYLVHTLGDYKIDN